MSEHLPANTESGPPARMEDFGPTDYQDPFTLREMGDEAGFSLKGLLPAMKRYWWVLVVAAGVGVGAGYVAYNNTAPMYRTEGSIWIATESRGDELSGPIMQGGLFQSEAWTELLVSYEVLDPVVVEQRLYLGHAAADSLIFRDFRLDSLFAPGAYSLEVALDGRAYTLLSEDGMVIEEGNLGGPIASRIGFLWSPSASAFQPEQTVDFSVVSPRDAARSLGQRLQHNMDRQGNFIHLALEGGNPEKVTRTLNAVMSRHVSVAADLKRVKLDELTLVLAEQLDSAGADLLDAERSLEGYQVQTVTLPSAETSPIVPGLQSTTGTVMSEYFTLRVQQDELRRDRIRLENALAQAQRTDSVRVESFEMIGAVQASSPLTGVLSELTVVRAELRGLRERYHDEFAPVAELIRREQTLERRTIPNLANILLDEIRGQETDLSALLGSRETELAQIPPRAIEEARRQRDLAIADGLYVDIQRRSETARLAAASSIPDVRILDEAIVPRVPSGDQRVQFGLIGFLIPLGLAILLIMLLDRMDPRLRNPADIGGDIGLDWLATIPRYRRGAIGGDNSEEIREAFRDLRMKIDFAFGTTRPLIMSITSPSEGEGKTFVSANLANAFADLGLKTILVDGDTRRGDLHHILERNRKPGLTDFLMNGRSHQIIQETDNPKLHFVGFGSRTTSSPELVNSSQMQALLASLKRRYEVVILDCPPMAAGSDAFILGAHAGSVLMVLRSGTTDKALAAAQLESFLRLPVRLLGAVLNDFTPQIGQGQYKYYSHYLPGYEASDEPEDVIEVETEDEVVVAGE